jgi:hypothetical protein
VALPLTQQARPESYLFVAESLSGFEDAQRFDPVSQPQDIRFEDVKVRCLARIDQSQPSR